MLVNIKAIVLTTLKFGESDLIVKCYTEEGLKSYLLKRILKSKSKRSGSAGKLNIAYFQPLTQLLITANHNSKGHLNSIKESRISYLYQTLSTNFYKQAIVFFLAETLASSLHEEKDPTLFQYLETAFIWLDNHDKTANFHLLFLLNLTKYLGFYPQTENKNFSYFDLLEGHFTNTKPLNNFVSGGKLILFRSLIGIKFDVIAQLQLNGNSRKILLEIMLDYYEIHISGFKKPKSLNVLKEVFK